MKLIVFRTGPDTHLADEGMSIAIEHARAAGRVIESRDFLNEGCWESDRWYALVWVDAESATYRSGPPSVTRDHQLDPDAVIGPCVSEDIAFRSACGRLMRAVAGRMS